ncbi:MAG: hypothetical protein NT036_03990 [Candidatus Omnitrophica bacterium]|nr:hypothetical protein [Candidatus Omnitrophota bacterium]
MWRNGIDPAKIGIVRERPKPKDRNEWIAYFKALIAKLPAGTPPTMKNIAKAASGEHSSGTLINSMRIYFITAQDIGLQIRKHNPPKTRDQWIAYIKEIADTLPEDVSPTRQNISAASDGKLTNNLLTKAMQYHAISFEDAGMARGHALPKSRKEWLEWFKNAIATLPTGIEPIPQNIVRYSSDALTPHGIYKILYKHGISYEEAGMVRENEAPRSRQEWVDVITTLRLHLDAGVEPTLNNIASSSNGRFGANNLRGAISYHLISYKELGIVRERRSCEDFLSLSQRGVTKEWANIGGRRVPIAGKVEPEPSDLAAQSEMRVNIQREIEALLEQEREIAFLIMDYFEGGGELIDVQSLPSVINIPLEDITRTLNILREKLKGEDSLTVDTPTAGKAAARENKNGQNGLLGMLGVAGDGKDTNENNENQTPDKQDIQTGHDQSPSLMINVATTNVAAENSKPATNTPVRKDSEDKNWPITNAAKLNLPTSNSALPNSVRCDLPSLIIGVSLPQETSSVNSTWHGQPRLTDGEMQQPPPTAASEPPAAGDGATQSSQKKVVAPRPARDGETSKKGPLEPGSGTRVHFKSDPDKMGEPSQRAAQDARENGMPTESIPGTTATDVIIYQSEKIEDKNILPWGSFNRMMYMLVRDGYIAQEEAQIEIMPGGKDIFSYFFEEAYVNALESLKIQWKPKQFDKKGEIGFRAVLRNGKLWISMHDNGTGITLKNMISAQRNRPVTGRGTFLHDMGVKAASIGWRLVVDNQKDTHGAIVSLVIPSKKATQPPAAGKARDGVVQNDVPPKTTASYLPRSSKFVTQVHGSPYLTTTAYGIIVENLGKVLPENAKILDLMTGCHTYLPDDKKPAEVAGLGLNSEEMSLNTVLNGNFMVQDLNENPVLSQNWDGHFDVVQIVAGMAYLEHFSRVFASAVKASKPGGVLFIAYDDTYDPEEATDQWKAMDVDLKVQSIIEALKTCKDLCDIKHVREEYSDPGFVNSHHILDIITAHVTVTPPATDKTDEVSSKGPFPVTPAPEGNARPALRIDQRKLTRTLTHIATIDELVVRWRDGVMETLKSNDSEKLMKFARNLVIEQNCAQMATNPMAELLYSNRYAARLFLIKEACSHGDKQLIDGVKLLLTFIDHAPTKADVEKIVLQSASPTTAQDSDKNGDGDRFPEAQPPAADGITAQNVPDIENLLQMLSDMVPVKSKQDEMKYYRIRYDATKIPKGSPAEDLLKLYCERVLPMYMRGKDRIKLVASDGKGQSLISVECFNDKGMTNRVGQGRVDVEEGNALRLIGMLNMAFLASQIPDNVPPDEIKSQYSALIAIIEKQCNEIMADAKPLSDVIEYTANGIWIKLPHAAQVPVDKIDEYYRLTITQLEQSA